MEHPGSTLGTCTYSPAPAHPDVLQTGGIYAQESGILTVRKSRVILTTALCIGRW